jgi:hypothetical protein
VDKLVALRLEGLRQSMAVECATQAAALAARVAQLEQAQAAPPANSMSGAGKGAGGRVASARAAAPPGAS